MWKDIIGYKGLYQINESGQIRNIKGNVKKQAVTNSGYLVVDLYKNNIRHTLLVHRLVAQVFIPNPDNLEIINHIDGNKLNNNSSNLEWCDYTTNLNHARKNNLRPKEWQYQGKLTKEEILEIPRLVELGLSKIEIARLLCVNIGIIKHIFEGKTYFDFGIDFTKLKPKKKTRWEEDKKLPEKYIKYLNSLKSKHRAKLSNNIDNSVTHR